MNLADARTRFAERGFDYLSAASMNLMLNRARNDFEDFWTWPWLYRTTTGAAPLTISDLKYVLLVKDADTHRELLGLDVRQVGQDNTDLNAAGDPACWYLDGPDPDDAVLNVWPVAAVTLDVRYVAQSRELSNNSDEPSIPGRYHALWIDLAVVQAYKDSDNFPAAQALATDTAGRLQALVERYETINRQNPSYITQRSFSEDD